MTQLPNGKHQVVIVLDEDTYWELVKMGADVHTPVDEYIENFLATHIMEQDDNTLKNLSSLHHFSG